MTPSMNREDYWGGSIVWLSPKDIKADEVSESELKITAKGLGETGLEEYPAGCLFIVARSGILKRTLPVAINRVPAAANQDMKVLVPFLDGQERYLQIMFRGLTDFILRELVKTGTTVQSLKYAEFEEQPFPLPPLLEQHRVVTKVDELMALCDRLEAARTEREATRDRYMAASLARLNAPDPETFHDDARFALDSLSALTAGPDQIKHLRQTILSLAVRGKLVEQDRNDESASELLKRIAAENTRRIKQGTLREQKPIPPIQEKEIEFEVASGWKWVRMAEVIKLWNGYAFKSQDFQTEGIPVIRISDLQGGEVNLSDTVHVSNSVPRGVGPEVWIPPNALLIAMSGATTGKTAINRTEFPILLNQRVGRIEVFLMSVHFIRFFFETIIARNLGISFGTAIPNLSAQQINEIPIPIPPLSEQHRIVAKVDELMALCNQLEVTLTAADDTRRRLLEALLDGALTPEGALDREAAE
jgi:type I restriction enzyme S subunit